MEYKRRKEFKQVRLDDVPWEEQNSAENALDQFFFSFFSSNSAGKVSRISAASTADPRRETVFNGM